MVATSFLLMIINQLSQNPTSFSSFALVDAATTSTIPSSSALSPWSTSLLQQLQLPQNTASTPTTEMQQRRRRRRNNTGFFYGIRDDDILLPFFSNCNDGNDFHLEKKYENRISGHCVGRSSGGAPMHRWWTSLMRRNDFVQPRRIQNKSQQQPHAEGEDEERERQIQLISSKTSRHHQDDRRWQERMHLRQPHEQHRTTSLSVTPKTATNAPATTHYLIPKGGEGTTQVIKRRKRRNNTGFYYGIREDVLTMPSIKPSPQRPSLPSSMSTSLSSVAKNPVQPSPIPRKDSDVYNNINNNNNNNNNEEEEKDKNNTKITPKLREGSNDASSSSLRSLPSSSSKNKFPLMQKPTNSQKKNNGSNRNNNTNIDRISSSSNNNNKFNDGLLSEAIREIRGMREEIIALREELQTVKKTKKDEDEDTRQGEGAFGKSGRDNISGSTYMEEDNGKSKWWRQQEQKPREEETTFDYRIDEVPEIWERSIDNEYDGKDYYDDGEEEPNPSAQKQKKLRKEDLEQIGKDVEMWASSLLSEEEGWGRAGTAVARGGGGGVGDAREDDEQQQWRRREDGWKEITCNNFVKKKFNRLGQTRVFLKWMPDSRDENNVLSSQQQPLYPCLKCYSTLDAPLDKVCSFLAHPETMTLYNELIDDHRDVEIISPSSKITWCKVPKILFVKPRDFVTYCSHRWKKDGTQVIVNQACEHEDMPGVMMEGQGDVCRGFALRGANFISKDPNDPNRTRITMLSHANPGGGLPQWAMNTAVNAAVQIEPFKFFHKINESVCDYREPLQYSNSQFLNAGGLEGRSTQPAGIAHLGFTCFWPNGGGLKESGPSPSFQPRYQQQNMWDSEDDDEDEIEEFND